MKFLSSSTLGLASFASLAAAAPFFEAESGVSPALLQKRSDPWHFCWDESWKKFGHRAFRAGLRTIAGDDADPGNTIPELYLGEPGWCNNLWCGGKGDDSVVFYLCGTPEAEQIMFTPKDLAQKFHDGFHDCNGKTEPVDKAGVTSLAFHVWSGNYSLHVEGFRTPDIKCPQEMNKKAFPFPDELNHPPYKTDE